MTNSLNTQLHGGRGDKPWQHAKPILGLTGAPGSGKSTVAKLFAELGCGIIDADRLAHQALDQPGVKQQLVEQWGEDILASDGGVDRPALGKRVFGDPEALKRLEAIIHPRVHAARAEARERLLADPSILAIVEDCPLLLEAGLASSCDRVIFVDCPHAIRLERVQQSRGWDEAELQKREQLQLSLDTKRESADDVISNASPIESVRADVKKLFQRIAGR